MDLNSASLIVLVISIIVLAFMSIINKDIAFIVQRPASFFAELICVGAIPALIMVFVFSRTRLFTSEETKVWFLASMFKLMVFHILLQTSGVYSAAFGTRGLG